MQGRQSALMIRPLFTCLVGASLLLSTTLMTGCTVGPDYRPPRVDAPVGWAGTRPDVTAATQPSTNPATRPSVATEQPVDVAQWWTAFNDPVLDSLIDRAVQSNLDIGIAAARLRQARASRGVVAAGVLAHRHGSAAYNPRGPPETPPRGDPDPGRL